MLNLGLRVPGYVYGALLGMALLALRRRGTPTAIAAGVIASIVVVLGLQALNIAFFWWYPIACLVVILTTLLTSRLTGRVA